MEEKDWKRAVDMAMDIMGAIAEDEEETLKEAYPPEWKAAWETCGRLTGREAAHLREELQKNAGIAGTPFLYRRIYVYRGREEEQEERKKTAYCTVVFRIGRPFEDGRLGWDLAVELFCENGAWFLTPEWVEKYLLG